MTVVATPGSGIGISAQEKDPRKQNAVMRSLLEGRSNAVGTTTLVHDGTTTTTTVTAVNCGLNSVPFLMPQTAHAAAVVATTFISAVALGSFTITHAATSNTDVTFGWVALG